MDNWGRETEFSVVTKKGPSDAVNIIIYLEHGDKIDTQ